jgi:hypothetical protein
MAALTTAPRGSSATLSSRDVGTTAPHAPPVSVPASGPAHDYAAYLVHAGVAIAGPRGTLSPLSAAQLDQVIKGPDPLWMSGAQGTPCGTAVEHASEFGADEILLGSYSACFPTHSTPTGLQPEFDHLIAWVLVGRPFCAASSVTDAWATGRVRRLGRSSTPGQVKSTASSPKVATAAPRSEVPDVPVEAVDGRGLRRSARGRVQLVEPGPVGRAGVHEPAAGRTGADVQRVVGPIHQIGTQRARHAHAA